MAFCDFVVKYDPEKESPDVLTERIIYSIWVGRLRNKKPVIAFIGADSGEGKSLSLLTFEYILLKVQGVDMKEYVNDINIYVPIEYPKKLDAILGLSGTKEEKARMKKVNVLGVHEARELVKAKLWYSFLNQTIGDINALSRSIKRLAIFITSQFIRDISTDIRYTLNYYITIKRPKGRRARATIYVLWKDDRDLEKPKLKKRRLSGYIVTPDGRMRHYIPQYLELSEPPKEIVEVFEKNDNEAKQSIIRRKLDRLVKEMEIDIADGNNKIKAMVDFYTKNLNSLNTIGKRRGDKWVLNQDLKSAHDLSDGEVKDFQNKLNEKLKLMKVFSSNQEELTEDDLNA